MFLQCLKKGLVVPTKSAKIVSGGHNFISNSPAMQKLGLQWPKVGSGHLRSPLGMLYSVSSHIWDSSWQNHFSEPNLMTKGLHTSSKSRQTACNYQSYQPTSQGLPSYHKDFLHQKNIPSPTRHISSHSVLSNAAPCSFSPIISPLSSSSSSSTLWSSSSSCYFSTSSSASSVDIGVPDSATSPKLTMSYAQGSATPLLWGKTLGQCMDDMAEQKPDHEAFVFVEEGIRLTYSQFREQVDRLAAGFVAIGLGKGDRIGIWDSNTSEWVLTQFAAARIGAILVTVNLAYRPNELYHTLQKAGVKVVVSAQNYKTQNYYEMLSTVCPELTTSAPGRVRNNKLPMLESVIMLGKGDFPGAYMFDDVIDMGTSEDKVKVEGYVKTVQFDDPACVLFTSGTTGNPKGAILTHHRVVNNGYHIGIRVGYHKGEHKMCLPVPLYHVFAAIGGPIVGITHGVTNVYPTAGYEPLATLQAIQDERCTFIYGTPTMFIDMMSQPAFKEMDVSSIQCGIIGGAPCPPELLKQITKGMGMNYIAVGYGMTESGPMICIVNEEDPGDKKYNTVGRLCQHMEGKVIDPQTGYIVPVGVPGELCVRGYANMTGYWESEDETKAAIDANNWLHTGDMATLDEDGYCCIVGRIKELIISGGRNIYPVEIEKYIHTHPKVEDVEVIGIPDERLGEKVVACVRVKAGEELTQEDITKFCQGEISHYKIPRHVVFLDAFPMTVTGKVQKFKLQETVSAQLK